MSDTSEPTSPAPQPQATEVKAAAPSPEPAKPKRSRGQKWRRRIIAFLVIVIFLGFAFRALVPLLLPSVMRSIASDYGLHADYDKFDFYPLAGDVGLWNLRLTPSEGGEPVLQVGYCRGAVDVWSLLQGRILVERAEADGAQLTVERSADRTIPLLERFLDKTAPAVAEPTGEPAAATEIPMESPLHIRSLRLQNAQARLIDKAVAPTTDVRLILNMLLSDVGSPNRPTVFAIQLNSPELLGALYVDGSALARDRKIEADLAVRMVGLNPQPVQAYLAAFGIAPLARDLSGEAKGKLHVTPAGPTTLPTGEPAPVTALAATLSFSDIALTADSKPAASVGKVEVVASTIAPGEIRVDRVDVHSVRARGWRDAEGRLGFAGLALGAEPTSRPVVQLEQPTSAAPTTTPSVSSMPIVELKSMNVRDIAIAFDDFTAGTALSIQLDHFNVTGVSTDPKHASQPATIELAASAPGVAGAIRASGEITAATETKTFAMKIEVDQITGERLDPYLTPLGLSRAMRDARFSCDLNGSLRLHDQGALTLGVDVQNLLLADAGQEWFAFSKISARDIHVRDAASHIRLGKIEVHGPAMHVHRASDGSITTLGFTFDPTKVATPAKSPASAPAVTDAKPAAKVKLPVVEIGSFKWDGVALTLDDLTSDPPVNVKLNDVAVTVDELTFDPTSAPEKQGRISVRATAPGNVEQVSIDGTLAPTGEALVLNLNGDLSGITLASLKPLLGTFGVEPILKSGQLTFGVQGAVQRLETGTHMNLSVNKVSLVDGEQTWIRSSGLSIEKLSFDFKTLGIDKVRVEPSVLSVQRDASGTLSAAGMKLIAPTNAPPPAPVDPEAPPIPSRVELALPVVVKVKALEVENAGLDFVDRAVSPEAKLSPRVTLSLNQLVLGADEGPAKLDLRLGVPGVVEQLVLTGDVQASPAKQGADLTLKATGVSGAAMAPYLPPGVKPSSQKGTIDAKFSASLTPNPDGGSAIRVSATNVVVSDGIAKEPAFKLDWARLGVKRFDLAGKVVAIEEAGSSGVSLRIHEDERGIVLPLLAIVEAPAGAPDAAPAPKEVEKQAAVGAATDVKDLLAAGRVQAAWITIDRMALRADKISVQTKQMASPLVFDGLCIWNATPIDLLGADAHRRPAFDLEVYGGVEKLLDRLTITTRMRPFASEPFIHADVEAAGIHADQITAMVPKLADTIDAKGLSDGRFVANVELSQLAFTRRGLWGIDFTRDVGGELLVKNTALYQTGVEKPLAGVEEIRAEKIRVSPKMDGGIGQVSIKRVDITKPSAHIVRDASGITALGVTLKMPTDAPATDAAPAPAQSPAPPAQQAAPAEQKVTEAVSALEPQGDIRIDSFTVSGIDLLLEDRVGDPVTLLPITELDVDVRGINTRALREPLPIKFSVLAGSGKVNDKDVFAQFTASGALTVYPKPSGWIKSSLSGFELTSVKGIAQQMGIGIGGGTFDFATDVRMEGLDQGVLRLYPTLNDLSVTDSADGTLAKFFQLPAPLNISIQAVEDVDGAISIPVVVPIEAGEIKVGTIVRSAIGAISKQVAIAVAQLPEKLARASLSVLGPDLLKGKEKDLTPVVLQFSSGESQLTYGQRQVLQELAQRLRKEETLQAQIIHTLGSGDVVLAGQRASPKRDEARELGQRLRQQKFDLQRKRIELSSTLRVAMASQNQALTDQTLNDLQQVSSQLASTELALDDMLSLLRPGAQRTLDRRARQAAIDLGQYRLEAVQEPLKSLQIKNFDTRVTVPRPNAKVVEGVERGSVTIVLTRQAKK